MNQNINLTNTSSGDINTANISQKIIINQNIEKSLQRIIHETHVDWNRHNSDGKILWDKIAQSNKPLYDINGGDFLIRNFFFDLDDIHLNDIYVPLTLSKGLHKYDFQKKEFIDEEDVLIDDDFLFEKLITSNNGNIVNIIGNAGQGKSTLLLKILLNQILNGSLLPISINFRNISTSIIDSIKIFFEERGIAVQEGEIIGFLKSKKVLLIIDGFDEIGNDSIRRPLVDEIKRMKNVYQLNILCSSRFGTELCYAREIINYNVLDLEITQVINIICNILKTDSDRRKRIISLVHENESLRQTLKTPLLVTLLIACYPYMDIIPKNAKSFYDGIFGLLHSRHDMFKEGNQVVREFVNNYDIQDAKDIFSLLCFYTFSKNLNSFSIADLNTYLKDALKFFQKYIDIKNDNLTSFCPTLISGTSLIIKDGKKNEDDRYVFIHKTIQEFYAAIFFNDKVLSNVSDSEKQVYSSAFLKLLDNDSARIISFLKFLAHTNKDFFLRYIVIPYLNTIGFDKDDKDEAINFIYEKLFSNLILTGTLTLRKREEYFQNDGSIIKYDEEGLVNIQTLSFTENIFGDLFSVFIEEKNLVNDAIRCAIEKLISFDIEDIEPLTIKEKRALTQLGIVKKQISITSKQFTQIREHKDSLKEEATKLFNLFNNRIYLPSLEYIEERDRINNLKNNIDDLFAFN